MNHLAIENVFCSEQKGGEGSFPLLKANERKAGLLLIEQQPRNIRLQKIRTER